MNLRRIGSNNKDTLENSKYIKANGKNTAGNDIKITEK